MEKVTAGQKGRLNEACLLGHHKMQGCTRRIHYLSEAWTKYQGSFNATTFWLHNAHATEAHVLTIPNFWPKIIPKCTEECCTCKFPGGDQGWPEPWSSRLSRIHIVLHWYFLPPNIASKKLRIITFQNGLPLFSIKLCVYSVTNMKMMEADDEEDDKGEEVEADNQRNLVIKVV